MTSVKSTSALSLVVACCGAFAAGIVAPAPPALADTPIWGPSVEIGGRFGSSRSYGDIDLFVPLVQTDRSLLFGNIRAAFDDRDSQEGNFGLGVRHMLDNGWNLGAYGFADIRNSPNDNTFTQATLGVEALSADWDLRVNAYLPFGNTTQTSGRSTTTATRLVDAGLVVDDSRLLLETQHRDQTTIVERRERALSGVDAEIGYRLPITAPESGLDLRVYAGGYHFDASGTDAVTGPRGRAELTWHDVPGLGTGSRLTAGVESQGDDVRGGQHFAGVRLRLPLQEAGTDRRQSTTQERRMTDRVIRDVDIVTGAAPSQTTTNTATRTEREEALDGDGESFGHVAIVRGNGADLKNAVESGDRQTIVASGENNPYDGNITLREGQRLLGGAYDIEVMGADDGQRFVLTVPGTRPTIRATQGNPGIVAASRTTIDGVRIVGDGSADGIVIPEGRTTVRVTDNDIISSGDYGISVGNRSSDIRLRNNTVTGAGTNGIFIGSETSRVTVAGNTVRDTGQSGIFANLNSRSLTIADNTVSDTGRQGIWVNPYSRSVTITGNTVSRTGDGGIALNPEIRDAVIADNTVTDVVGNGIQIAQANNGITVRDNTVSRYGGAGISIAEATTETIVTGNRVNNGFGGIDVASDVSGITISGNTIDMIGSHAVSFGHDVSDITVRENRIGPIGGSGVRVGNDAVGVTVADNAIDRADGNAGIEIGWDSDDVSIAGNRISTIFGSGILVGHRADNVTVADNRLSESFGFSGFVLGTGDFSGSGNRLGSDTTTGGGGSACFEIPASTMTGPGFTIVDERDGSTIQCAAAP
ncbi:right-handed parallel beta-helix repeat-containing protein [Fodinicurvata sp. EGI_FJ10296]|uniref:right-handed parallel beta-helix repeat-containing protein n=1 Tax=Fodinicurvata sp. EGI_FJ10296 TaxID=3231908 RepID=UPI003452F9C8